jgi:RNA recognition motif-containing protein
VSKKLYVGSLSYDATEESLRKLFTGIGEVDSVKIITDLDTRRSKGFGFVEMSSAEDAKKAIEQLNGTKFMERTLTVNEARPQQPREGRGFGGNRGGYGQGKGAGYGRDRR